MTNRVNDVISSMMLGAIDPMVNIRMIITVLLRAPFSDSTEIAMSGTGSGSGTSSSGTVYVLQSSTNATAAIPDWVPAGIEVTGNGADMMLFDPAGYDAGKTYRVIEAP